MLASFDPDNPARLAFQSPNDSTFEVQSSKSRLSPEPSIASIVQANIKGADLGNGIRVGYKQLMYLN
jgi:hypothetical protein